MHWLPTPSTPLTVMKHYGRFLPQKKLAQAAEILNEVWEAELGAEDAAQGQPGIGLNGALRHVPAISGWGYSGGFGALSPGWAVRPPLD